MAKDTNSKYDCKCQKKSKRYTKSFYVRSGPSVSVSADWEDFAWTIGDISGKDGILTPGVDIDEVIYEVVDKNGNILDTQTAAFGVQEDGGSE